MFINADTGLPRNAGSVVKPPQNLCSTYKILARNGGSDFYTGQLAELVSDDLHNIGSVITKKDLESFRYIILIMDFLSSY